jgi:DHA1 family multidrug resistance protein-like MFS transporter
VRTPAWPALTPIRQMYLAMFFVAIAASILSSTFPPYVRQTGYDVAAVGFLVSIFSVMSLASRLPAGALAAARRSHLVSAGATLLLALSSAAYALAGDLVSFTVVRALNGCAYGVVTTVNMALVMEAIDRPDRRASVTGWYLGWIAAGHAVGGFLSGILVDNLGFHTAYVVVGAGLLVTVPFALARRAAGPARSGAAAHPTPHAPRLTRQWTAVLSVALLVPALGGFSVNALSQVMWTFYPLYGLSVGLTLTALGFHSGAFSLTSMIARLLIGQTGPRLSYQLLTTGTLVTTAVVTALIPLFSAFLPLLLFNIALGGLRAGALVGSMVAAIEYGGGDARKRGVAAGVYTFGSDSAMVAAPLIGGVLAEQIGLASIFWALPALLMTLYFALLGGSVLAERRERARPQPS